MRTLRIIGVCGLTLWVATCAASKPAIRAPLIPPLQTGYLEARDVRVHYRQSPQGTTGRRHSLLMIHGFGGSSESWNDVLPLLSPPLHIVCIDLKGFGLSDKPRNSNYSIDEQAEIVAAFVRVFMEQPVVLVGHSYGGAVAFLSYLKLRDRGESARVAGLVLVDAAAYQQELPFFVAQLRNPFTRFFAENFTTPEWRIGFVLRRLFVDKSKVDAERVDRYAKYLRLPGAEHAIARAARQILPSNPSRVSARLKTIELPTQVIWGDRDPTIPVTLGRRLAADIPGASLEIVANSGHVPHEEHPVQTAQVILRFVEALP